MVGIVFLLVTSTRMIRIASKFRAVGGADAEEEEEEAVVARMHRHTKPKPICMDWRGPSVGIVLLTMGVRTTRTNPAKTLPASSATRWVIYPFVVGTLHSPKKISRRRSGIKNEGRGRRRYVCIARRRVQKIWKSSLILTLSLT